MASNAVPHYLRTFKIAATVGARKSVAQGRRSKSFFVGFLHETGIFKSRKLLVKESNRMGCGASSAATVRQAAERPAELGTDCVASGGPVVQQYKVGMKIGRGKSLTKIFPPDTTLFHTSCLGASGPCRRTVEALL